ncbi:MAG: DNA polymerase III subunit alpha [Sphingobacteriaceae bacterium]|nr:DNA polymerase III subunit alpha [Sphingobacteriaceae bacterium]
MFLIFDTETTGLPRNYNAPPSDADNWPRLVQLAWQLHDAQGKLLDHHSVIVKPEGYTIPFNAVNVHGITTDRALKEGVELKAVLTQFINVMAKAQYICGHNILFDVNIVAAELLRCGESDVVSPKSIIDTKNDQTTNFCAIPGGRGGKFKWPTLTELYTKLFGSGFAEAHNAAFDVQATSKTFFEILKRGIIQVKEISKDNLADIHYEDVDLSELLEQEKKLKQVGKSEKEVVVTPVEKIKDVFSDFVHLHNHSQYSVLQSVSNISDLVKKASEYNMPALALTDHGNMYAAFLFWQAIEKENKNIKAHNEKVEKGEIQDSPKNILKCIFGCEFNITVNHKEKSKQDNGFAVPFLAKNKNGYENLCKLSSIGFVDGMYYVPRIDKEVLLKYKSDLICFTGSLLGEIPHLILNVGEEKAEEVFLWYKEQFQDDFYVELNRHGLPEEDHVNEVLLRFAKKHQVKYFAANNNYYLEQKSAYSRDILIGVKEGLNFSTDQELKELKNNSRLGKLFLANNDFYFKSPAQMTKSFADLPEALACTKEIADKVESFKLGRDVLLPKFKIPDAFLDARDQDPNDEGKGNRGENAYLRHLTYEGAKKKYPNITPEIQERIDFELSVMERMGFPGYFLIVSDFTTEARRLGVSVGPGRGSAAGSAVAFCLGITNVDPIKYDLLFERFLNPDRISMPDIDIDFDDEGRDKVIKYVIDKYGINQVAQIITYGTMGGKSAIRDTARVLNLPLSDADKLAKSFPDSLDAQLKSLLKPGGIDEKYLEKVKDRREVVEQSYQFRKLAEENSREADILKQAYELEGCVRNTGVHACGVIITPDELTKFVPVTKGKDSEMLLTQFDNSVAESAGLLKMDFLGLRTLTIIKDAIAFVKLRFNKEIDIDTIDLNDKTALELFQRGETNGIFQFESPGMQKHLKDLKPDSFTDLIAMNALYRPGPLAYIPNYIARKHGREQITYDLEGMDEFLKETYGITVYQEQVMRLSQKLANFTKGDADTLRKAMGKKQKDVLDKMKSKFLDGCNANGHDKVVAEKVWKDWEAFASYAFNKSHSTCYAFLAMQTAYLKAHYPAEFMASVLNHSGNIDKIAFFMEECKRMGIKVQGPDVNEGFGKFSVMSNGNIRFGMASIKGVGENVVNNIVEERNANGKYNSVFDLVSRLDTKTINKKSIEGLALSGALDSFENLNRAMFFVADTDGTTLTDKIIKFGNQKSNGVDSSQASLFGEEEAVEVSEPTLPNIEPWSALEQLAREKEVVGFYISGHPLDPYKVVLEHRCNANCSQLKNGLENFRAKEVYFGGIITGFENRTSKTGNAYGKLIVEDYHGTYEIMLFGKDFIEYNKFMVQGLFVFIKARVQDRYNQPGSLELKVNKIELLEQVKENAFNSIRLKVKLEHVNDELINKIERLIATKAGKSTVEFFVEDEIEKMNVKLYSNKNKVAIDNEFLLELDKMVDISYDIV